MLKHIVLVIFSLLIFSQAYASEYCTSGDYQDFGLNKICISEGTLIDFELTKSGKPYATVFFEGGKTATLTALKVVNRRGPNMSILSEVQIKGSRSSFVIDVEYEQGFDSHMLVASLTSYSKELRFYIAEGTLADDF